MGKEGGQDDREVGMCATCGFLASQKCGNCKQVFYCKKECQKQDWKNGHKDQCRPIRISENAELGRYLEVTRDFKAGDVIFTEDPIVVGPEMITEPVCLSCYKRVDGSYRCSKCNWPLCNASCENGEDHLPECIVGQEIGSPIEIHNFDETNHFYEVVSPLRCLALKKKSKKKYELLMNFESHYEERKDSENYKENHKRIVNMLRNYFFLSEFSPESIDASENNIHKVIGIIDTNYIDIRLPQGDIMGIFPLFIMIEHSCMPNTKITFNKKKQLTVKAAYDIKRGEHLTTTYTHTFWGTIARREHLKLNKFFMCTCKRCADPTELGTNFSALKCQNCPQGYLTSAAPLDELADWICSNCDYTMCVDKVKEITMKLGEEIEQVLAFPSIQTLEKLIEKCTTELVHPNHFHLFAVKHTLLQLYGREGGFDEEVTKKKEKLCKEFIQTCTTLEPALSHIYSYASVALYEYHLAIMSRSRQISSPSIAASTENDIETAKALLRQCINLLKDEFDELPEGQLRLVAQRNLQELEEWSS